MTTEFPYLSERSKSFWTLFFLLLSPQTQLPSFSAEIPANSVRAITEKSTHIILIFSFLKSKLLWISFIFSSLIILYETLYRKAKKHNNTIADKKKIRKEIKNWHSYFNLTLFIKISINVTLLIFNQSRHWHYFSKLFAFKINNESWMRLIYNSHKPASCRYSRY